LILWNRLESWVAIQLADLGRVPILEDLTKGGLSLFDWRIDFEIGDFGNFRIRGSSVKGGLKFLWNWYIIH